VEARRSHGGTAPERIADQLECIRAILQRQKSVLPDSEPKRIVNDVALGRRGARGADS
jgi:hypothetical protein